MHQTNELINISQKRERVKTQKKYYQMLSLHIFLGPFYTDG